MRDKKNRKSETGKKLINALKKWLDNSDLLLWGSWESSFQSKRLNKYIENKKLELFLYDDGLKKSFAKACARTIKHFIDEDAKQFEWNLMRCQSELETIKTKSEQFLDKFGIILEDYDFSKEPYKTHGKNIAWLIFWIFLALMCIVGTIILYTNIPLLVVNIIASIIISLYLIIQILPEVIKYSRYIHYGRIYNARLDIYKSKTKDEAKGKLSWDMLKTDAVKECMDLRFPNNKENQNPPII